MARSATRKGLGLVEVILASALFAMLVTGLLGAYAYSQQSVVSAGDRARAVQLAEEGLEAARSIRDASWANLVSGNSGVSTTGSGWALAGKRDTIDIFTRQLSLTATSTNRVQVLSTVTWQQDAQRTGSVTLSTWLTYWMQRANWVSPSIGGGLDLASSTIAVEVATSGNYAYVVRNTGSGVPNFVVVDISNPSSPSLAASLTLNGPLTDVTITGNYALVSSGDDTREFQVVSIATPTAPSYAGAVDLLGTANATGVAFSGSVAYVTRLQSTSQELALINILNLLVPVSLSGVDIAGDATDVVVSGTTAYVSTSLDTAELVIVNAASSAFPLTAGTLNTTGTNDATTVALSGTTALLGFDNGVIRTINVATPSAPVALGSATTGSIIVQDVEWGTGNSVAFAVTSAAGTSTQLYAYNLTTPASPALLASLTASGPLYGIAYNGTVDRAVAVGANASREVTIIAP